MTDRMNQTDQPQAELVRRKKPLARRVFKWLVLGVLLFVGVAWFVGGRLVAPANREISQPPNDLPIVPFTIDSQSGSQIAGWYLPAEGATSSIVLCHGIRGDRRAMLNRARLLYEAGYSTLLIDLQAHGESPGEHITVGYLERHDVEATVEYARSLNPDHRIGVIGWSVGGAATVLAEGLELDALVLESVYPTVSEAVHNRVEHQLGWLGSFPAEALLIQFQLRLGIWPDQLRPIDRLSSVGCPVLLMCGSDDPHTPLAESQRMLAAAAEPKKLVVFDGAKHIDLQAYDEGLYSVEVLAFLRTHLSP